MGSIDRELEVDRLIGQFEMREARRQLPSSTMGEYSDATHDDKGGLYPLEEEGSYGRLPKKNTPGRWHEPEKYMKRELKPKIYSSYAISDRCELHSVSLDKYDSRFARGKSPLYGRASSSSRGSTPSPTRFSVSLIPRNVSPIPVLKIEERKTKLKKKIIADTSSQKES